MDNYLNFDGKYYAVDFEKIMNFVSNSSRSESDDENTISQIYGIPVLDGENDDIDDTIKLIRKEVTETKRSYNDTMSNYRYGLVMNFLNMLMQPISDGSGSVMLTNNSNDMHIGQRLAFNTLFEMEIIYEIELED